MFLVSPKPLGLTKFWQRVKVFSMMRSMWSNFGESLLTHVGVIALFGHFFAAFDVITFKNLLLRNYYTEFNESWYFCYLEYPAQNGSLDF